MQFHGAIHQFPKEIKLLIISFLVALSIGFYGGITFVKNTTKANPKGIEQRYLGNEDDENATKMQFKKSKAEVLTLVHNHILSLSIIFFVLGLILSTTSINKKLKIFLITEPFFSVLLTFGGIYLLWAGMLWMKYIIMFSGFLMTISFGLAVILILKQLLLPRNG